MNPIAEAESITNVIIQYAEAIKAETKMSCVDWLLVIESNSGKLDEIVKK